MTTAKKKDKKLHYERIEVLTGMANGGTIKDVANETGISETMATSHWQGIRHQYKLRNSADAAHLALAMGLIENKFK